MLFSALMMTTMFQWWMVLLSSASLLLRGRRSILDDINFKYKRIRIKVVESFVYLGALFHWKQSAAAAWADRENTAFKAFGSL